MGLLKKKKNYYSFFLIIKMWPFVPLILTIGYNNSLYEEHMRSGAAQCCAGKKEVCNHLIKNGSVLIFFCIFCFIVLNSGIFSLQ